MHKRAQGSHHASTHLHASTSWAQESTREPSHHSEFDLSSIYQISQAADALAAVDDMGGLQRGVSDPFRGAGAGLVDGWVGVGEWVRYLCIGMY